jgi:hypothetical protein
MLVMKLWKEGYELLSTDPILSTSLPPYVPYKDFDEASKVADFKTQFQLLLDSINKLCQTTGIDAKLDKCNKEKSDNFYKDIQNLAVSANMINSISILM